MRTQNKSKRPKRGSRGFLQTGGLLRARIREAGEKRGFSQTRLLTQWAETVGPAVAKIAEPVKVSYATQGFGATLTLLVRGANAPQVQMQIPQIISRVNACYGYNAISRVKITQTAPIGFAEDRAPDFKRKETRLSDADHMRIQTSVKDVNDSNLREALEALGKNIAAGNPVKQS